MDGLLSNLLRVVVQGRWDEKSVFLDWTD